MPKPFDDETHLPLIDEDRALPPEDRLPREDSLPAEESYSFDEFNVKKSYTKIEEEKVRKLTLKDLIFKPAVSLIAVITVVLASFGIDPLGKDSLFKSVTASGIVPSSSETTSPDDTTEPVGTEDTADTTDETTPPEVDDDVFPTLGNLDPDFAGAYAWSTAGSEEYIRFYKDGDTAYSYLVKGGAWDTYDTAGKIVDDLTATYDKATNTLTLKNFSGAMLDVNLMGNSFTIELEGDNTVGAIQIWGAMYAGSVTFSGSGTLKVTNGIVLNCEASASCMIVKRGVTLDISGESGAVIVGDTSIDEPAIYLSRHLKLTGGEIGKYQENDYGDGNVYYTYSVLDTTGEPSTHVLIENAD